MATFTLSVTSTVITISQGTGSIEDLYQDLYTYAGDAETYMTKTGADPYVYTILSARRLYIYTNAKFTLTEDNTLAFTQTVNTNPVLYVAAYTGTSFTVEPGATLDLSSTNPTTAYGLMRCYGSTYFNGTEAKPISVLHLFHTTIRTYNAHPEKVFNWVNFSEPYPSLSCRCFWFEAYSVTTYDQVSITNVTIDGLTGGVKYGWAFQTDTKLTSNITLDNITVSNCDYYLRATSGLKFTNSTFKDCYHSGYVTNSAVVDEMYNEDDVTDILPAAVNQQPKYTFENCTFENNYTIVPASTRGLNETYGAVVKFKDCTFKDLYYALYCSYRSFFLYEGTTTYTNVTDYEYFVNNAVSVRSYSLDLTVYESDGVTPVENASVTVRQAEGKEVYHFLTASDGKIYDLYGDLPVFSNRQGDLDSYVTWSDGTGNKYHIIEVVKNGVGHYSANVTFDEDQVITASLQGDGTATKIYNSTIYDSVIY